MGKQMKENERGLYYGSDENSFKRRTEIIRNMIIDTPEMVTPLPERKDFLYWSQRLKERQDQYRETSTHPEHITIKFPETTILNFIGDTHIGSPDTDYKRLEREINIIANTPNSYVVLLGDLVDGFFFNPAQFKQVEQPPEQWEYVNALLTFLASNKKLLVAISGDHDQWPTKMGVDPYAEFADNFQAYYMKGVSYMSIVVGETEYKITGAHRVPGHSMYNNAHPQMRAERFGGAAGSDIIVAGHTHRKGHSEQAYKTFPGISQVSHYISLGPYKATDDYAQKLGFSKLSPEEMYGCAVVLNKDTHNVTYYHDIIQANELH